MRASREEVLSLVGHIDYILEALRQSRKRRDAKSVTSSATRPLPSTCAA